MTKPTKKYCPNCSYEDNHPTFDATIEFDDAKEELVPVWECRHCHQTQPRRERKTQKTKEFEALLASGNLTLDSMLAHMQRHRKSTN